jgi:hypothetical protein
MKTVTLGALALLCVGVASTPASAAPLSLGLNSPDTNIVQQVGHKWSGKKKWWGHHRHRHHDGFGFWGVPFGFGLGFAASPYLYRYDDRPYCDGYWHRHRRNLWHCHGDIY